MSWNHTGESIRKMFDHRKNKVPCPNCGRKMAFITKAEGDVYCPSCHLHSPKPFPKSD